MARPLTPREKRMIRTAAIVLSAYLGLFYGMKGYRWLEGKRENYELLAATAEKVEVEFLREQGKALRLKSLREGLRIELDKLREDTVVGEARGAIQQAAQASGVQIGSSKESPGRAAGKELAMIQLDGLGTIPSVVQFLRSLRSLGYPVAIDRLQFQTAGLQPGQVKMSLTAVVLSFKEWKKNGEPGRA